MENRPMPPAGNHGYSSRPGGGRPRQRLARFKSRCHDGSKTEGDCRGRLDRARAAVALSDTLQYSYLYEKFRFQPREPRMSRTLILLGLLLIAVGLLWPWIGWLGLGHLPGDIVVERKNFTLYVPIATGLLISVVLTLLFWLINW